MNVKGHIILGTRGSALALHQAEMVKRELERMGVHVEMRVITTMGDRRTDVALSELGKVSGVMDKGVFLKELEDALLRGEIDIAVHSLKDVPSMLDDAFELGAVLPRADVRDVLIMRAGAGYDPKVLATGSVRRSMMAKAYWSSLRDVVGVRGNVNTRLSKLAHADGYDSMILAKAGLDRLALFSPNLSVDGVELTMRILPIEHFVPAAGQGAIGVEMRRADEHIRTILSAINDEQTWLCVQIERNFLARFGADCSTPIGVHAGMRGAELDLHVVHHVSETQIIQSRVQSRDPLDLVEMALAQCVH